MNTSSDQRQQNLHILQTEYTHVDSWSHQNLRAPFWRLYWQATEGAYIHFRKKRIALLPRQLYLIPTDTQFSTSARQSFDQLFIHFLLPLRYDCHPDVIAIEQCPYSRQLIKQVTEAVDKESLETTALIYYALTKLAPHRLTLRTPPQDRAIERAITYIDQHLGKNLSNEELAAEIHLHRNSFVRRFEKAIGLTPRKYIMQRRIEQACILLHNNTLSIDNIAEQAGFCDRYYFSRVFKKLRGTSPALYRTLLKG